MAADAWHPMLQRQLRRADLTPEALAAAHPQLPGLMDRISRAYADAEQDRYLMERSQEVASREMGELYNELRASQARLASLVSLSSDWIWEQDATLRFSYVSSHDLGCLGDLAGLLQGAEIGEHISPIDDDDARTHRQLTEDRKPFRNLRFRAQRLGSTPVYIRISGEPVFEGERFKGYRGVGSDVTSSTVAEQQVMQLARYDSLTGLPNRSMLIEQLESGLRQARNSRLGLAVLFIDLDRFKYVNDTLGHDAGDELLKVMAKRLSGLLRNVDTVARLGGDEFVILIHNTIDPSTLSKVAARVLNALCEPLRLAERPVQVSASVGIALFPSDGEDTTTLLKNADAAT
jgi:diguanylate cyclase (GGDEF)-like protein